MLAPGHPSCESFWGMCRSTHLDRHLSRRGETTFGSWGTAMAKFLSDKDIRKLFGNVIVSPDKDSVRPNSYILRLGVEGEFINTGKDFKLGGHKRGIKIPPGHSVGVTALETLDFRRETVEKVFPGKHMHALVTPTTNLAREGVVASATQVDAGFYGTLNWTLTNTSSLERRFVVGERLYRITFVLLDENELPENPYNGDYQNQTGYFRSKRPGAPVGMKDSEWEEPINKGGPEEMLEIMIKSGYPWNMLGERLMIIDRQYATVTDEYASINDTLTKINSEIADLRAKECDSSNLVRTILREETENIENRLMVKIGQIVLGLAGLVLVIGGSEYIRGLLYRNQLFLGTLFLICAVGTISAKRLFRRG